VTDRERERERENGRMGHSRGRWMLLLIRLWDFKDGLDLFKHSASSICSCFDVFPLAPSLSRFALLRRALIYTGFPAGFLRNSPVFQP
jgi:hypothetical protein